MFTTTFVSGAIVGLPGGIPHCEFPLPPHVLCQRDCDDCTDSADPDERLVGNGYHHLT